MKSVKKRFCISLLCLFGILWGLSMMLSVYAPEYITPQWHYLLLLFVVVSVIMFRKAINMRDKNDIYKLTNFHMIATILKLVGYLAIITIYVIKNPEDKIAFVVTFLTYYLSFSVFETYMLVRKKSEKNE
jgi:uncharacterized membrane protein YoaT (DUF817 family)